MNVYLVYLLLLLKISTAVIPSQICVSLMCLVAECVAKTLVELLRMLFAFKKPHFADLFHVSKNWISGNPDHRSATSCTYP